MKNKLKILTITISSAVILLFLITAVNQIAGFSNFISGYNDTAGQVTGVILSLLLLALFLMPAWFYLRMPARLNYPESGSRAEIDLFKKRLAEDLNRNTYIRANDLTVSPDNLDEAMEILDAEAHRELKESASVIFVSTAVSQSGKLDAFIVGTLLIKMVWRIAHIYNQRPSYSSLFSLYANVAATTLIAGSVEEIDISEQLEPVLGELIGASAFGAIPGLSQISAFTFACLMEGSINAFLALRMGEITIGYSRSITKPDRKQLRKSASGKAVGRLRKIINEFGSEVVKAVTSAAKNKTRGALSIKNWWGRTEETKKPGPDLSADEYLGLGSDSKG